MGKVGTFPQHLPSSLFLRGEGAAFQKKAPRKEGGGLAGEGQAGGVGTVGGSFQNQRRLEPARWFPPGPGRGIQAFSRESPDAKSRGGCPPAPPVLRPARCSLARFGVVGRSETVVGLLRCHVRALIWRLSFIKCFFSIFFRKMRPKSVLGYRTKSSLDRIRNNHHKNQRVGTSGYQTPGPGRSPGVLSPGFLPKKAGPPPGAGRGTTSQGSTCESPSGTVSRDRTARPLPVGEGPITAVFGSRSADGRPPGPSPSGAGPAPPPG